MDDKKVVFEEQRERLDNAIAVVVEDLDRQYLRKLQLAMHKCATKCCSNEDANSETVERCVKKCHDPVIRARNYMQNQVGEFQEQLQRCIMVCNDDLQYRAPYASCSELKGRVAHKFEECLVKCVDKHVALIPAMMATMRTELEKGAPSMPR